MSYTTFKYRLRSIPEKVKSGDEIAVTVDVTNTGEMDGDEVVQLYVSLPESNLQKPVRALQGFRRIHLKSGETRSVEFRLKPHQIAARNHENVPVVEAGKLQVSVGVNSPMPLRWPPEKWCRPLWRLRVITILSMNRGGRSCIC